MELLLLGTGAADGIPNPFCSCATCTDYRDRGELRTPTSVLVDGRLLIDPGPESPRQVSRHRRDLLGLQAILAGHAHHDHLDPAVLMHRSWVTEEPLVVAGPEPVVASAKPWLDHGSAGVTFTTLTAGDVVDLAGYRVTAVRANHHAFGEALCYRIEGGGRSVLYATDTGLLPEASLTALAGRPVDLVLLEETFGHRCDKGEHHLCFDTFGRTVAALRERGVITSGTRVVAVHVGHDNPPLAELERTLAGLGAEVLPDGTAITLS